MATGNRHRFLLTQWRFEKFLINPKESLNIINWTEMNDLKLQCTHYTHIVHVPVHTSLMAGELLHRDQLIKYTKYQTQHCTYLEWHDELIGKTWHTPPSGLHHGVDGSRGLLINMWCQTVVMYSLGQLNWIKFKNRCYNLVLVWSW